MPPLSSAIPRHYVAVLIMAIGAHASYILPIAFFADTYKILTLSAGFLGAFVWVVVLTFISCLIFFFRRHTEMRRVMMISGSVLLLALFSGAMWQIGEIVFVLPAVVLVLFFSHLLVAGEKNTLKRSELGILFFFAGPGGVFGLIVLAPQTFLGATALEICLIIWWGYIGWRMETPPLSTYMR